MPSARFADLLELLADREVDFIIVGMTAGVLAGAPVTTLDVDIVHRRTPENVARLLKALRDISAVYRHDSRGLVPTDKHLLSPGHQLLATSYVDLDCLGTIDGGRGYEDLLPSARESDFATAERSWPWICRPSSKSKSAPPVPRISPSSPSSRPRSTSSDARNATDLPAPTFRRRADQDPHSTSWSPRWWGRGSCFGGVRARSSPSAARMPARVRATVGRAADHVRSVPRNRNPAPAESGRRTNAWRASELPGRPDATAARRC